MSNVHYSSTNGQPTGRASHFYRDINLAGKKTADQNAKAIKLDIKSRYTMVTCDESEVVDKKSIR